MPFWSRFWRLVAAGAARQSWGLAAEGASWALVGLSKDKVAGVRVHAMEKILTKEHDLEWSGLGGALGGAMGGAMGQVMVRSRQQLSVALAESEVISGMLELPAQLHRDDWASEVQLEVALMLGLAPDEVNFDFQADSEADGQLSRVYWVGCDQARIRAIRDAVRAAGWRLGSVEPAWHAAHRAASLIKGGVGSLLTQAPQDWQFDLTRHEGLGMALSQRLPLSGVEEGPDRVLMQVLQSGAGPRLVASGLALKAWLS